MSCPLEEESANALVASEGGFAGDISFYNNAPAGSLVMMSLLPFLLLNACHAYQQGIVLYGLIYFYHPSV